MSDFVEDMAIGLLIAVFVVLCGIYILGKATNVD